MFIDFGNSLSGQALPFTVSENCDITAAIVPLPTVTDRLRATLNRLFRDRHFSKTGLAKACGWHASGVSMLLNGERGIHLNKLDAVAGYFGISIGELLGAAKPGELTGDEQRVVHAFRVLPKQMQAHFLALLESASVGATLATRGAISPNTVTPSRVYNSGGAQEGHPVSADPASELQRLRALISGVSVALATAATGAVPDQPTPGARSPETRRGRVAP